MLALYLFVLRKDRVRLSEIDTDILSDKALDDTRHHILFLFVELAEQGVALLLPDLLEDDILRVLGRYPSEFLRLDLYFNVLADLDLGDDGICRIFKCNSFYWYSFDDNSFNYPLPLLPSPRPPSSQRSDSRRYPCLS